MAFITGAARGQGRAHAVRMAQEGADIIAIDLADKLPPCAPYPPATQDDLDETARLVEATGRRILATAVDTRDLDGLRTAVDDGVATLGTPRHHRRQRGDLRPCRLERRSPPRRFGT